jgi:hypothetical protein
MLASITAEALVRIIGIGAFLAFYLVAKTIQRRRGAQIVVRDGRPALSDAARAALERQGIDTAAVEAKLEREMTVNERGEVVGRPSSGEAEAPEPAVFGSDERPRTKPQLAHEKERFESIWEKQDSGPSIWDDPDRDAFWGKSDSEPKR